MVSFNKLREGSIVKLRMQIRSEILGDRVDRPHAEVLAIEPRSFRIRIEDEGQCRVIPKSGADFALVRR